MKRRGGGRGTYQSLCVLGIQTKTKKKNKINQSNQWLDAKQMMRRKKEKIKNLQEREKEQGQHL